MPLLSVGPRSRHTALSFRVSCLLITSALVACSQGNEDTPEGGAGQSGAAGSTAGKGPGGSSGQAGKAGQSGTSGTSGQSGAAGQSGSGGQSGAGTSGTAGQGDSGASGQGGAAGESGLGGAAGMSGNSGQSGAADAGGAAGSAAGGADPAGGTSGATGGAAGTSGVVCAMGAQDNDGDGICAPACGPGACAEHASCADATGQVVCTPCGNALAGCDDGDLCTTDSCDAVTGCVHTAVVCEDGDGCTTDRCNAATGACEHALCDDSNACTQGACNTTTHTCSYRPVYQCSDPLTLATMARSGPFLGVPAGAATIVDGRLRVSGQGGTKGMVSLADKRSVREGFTATFGFNFSAATVAGGAGMAFVLHTSSEASQGKGGHDSTGIASTSSLSIELDSQKDTGDASARRLVLRVAQVPLKVVSLDGDWTNSGAHRVSVTYTPGKLSVAIDGVAQIADAAIDLTALGLVDDAGAAWLGFTASGDEVHDVTSFAFSAVCPAGACGDGVACTADVCDPTAGCQSTTTSGGDTDGDTVCDSLDACASSASDDADGNGVCDDVDLCAALAAVTITPAQPGGGDALTATIGAAPAVLAGAQLGHAWTRNGAPASTAASVAAGTIKAGESWSVTVTATQAGKALCSGSSSVSVGNQTPVCVAATLTPATAQATDALLCACTDPLDADKDVTGYQCSFTDQSGKVIATVPSTGATCQLPAGKAPAGSLVTCSIAPVDAAGAGTAADATAVVGPNSKPVAPSDLAVTLSQPSSNPTSTITCQDPKRINTSIPNNASFGDTDTGWSAYRFFWLINNQPAWTTTRTDGASVTTTVADLYSEASKKQGATVYAKRGDGITCRLDLWDGISGSTKSASATTTVKGSPVEILSLSADPSPHAWSPYACKAVIRDHDHDAVNVVLQLRSTTDAIKGPLLEDGSLPSFAADGTWQTVSVAATAGKASSLGGDHVSCYLKVTDPDGSDDTAWSMPTAQADPRLTAVTLTTSDSSVCASVQCTAHVSDGDTGDGTTKQSADVEVTWLVDGQPYGDAVVKTAASFGSSGADVVVTGQGLPVSGHAVACQARVRASSASSWSDPSTSTSSSLIGQAPSVGKVALQAPAVVRVGETLTCAATDLKAGACTGSSLTPTYRWSVNGQVVAGATGSTFSTAGLAPSDQVSCSAAASTSSLAGDYIASSPRALTAGTWIVTGHDAGSLVGSSVAVVDDLDGDGYGELLIGSPGASPGGKTSAGKVYLVPASASATTVSVEAVDQGTLAGSRFWTGESGAWDTTTGYCALVSGGCQPVAAGALVDPAKGPVGDSLGLSVLAPGDLDGDDVIDLVMAAPYARGSGGFREGRAYVVSGKTAASLPVGAIAAGQAQGWAVDGETGLLSSFVEKGVTTRSGDLLGWRLASGDFDGDGLHDLALGAPEFGGGWSIAQHGSLSWVQQGGGLGRSYVVYGSSTRKGLLWLYDQQQGTVTDRVSVIAGQSISALASLNWGSSLASSGDLDGDGLDDLYVGPLSFGQGWFVPGDALTDTVDLNANPAPAGTLHPSFNATLTNLTQPSSGPFDWVNTGKVTVLAYPGGVGDTNGDGRDDFALLAFENINNTHVATVSVFFDASLIGTNPDGPRLGTGGFAVVGRPSEGAIHGGMEVTGIGDFNGDGLDDLALWLRPRKDGVAQPTKIYVIHGRTQAGTVSFADIESGAAGAVFEADGEVLRAGAVTGGDIDGDGLSDLVAGISTSDGNTGHVKVWFGRDSRRQITHPGTAGSDSLTGTTGADILVGDRGDDVLRGKGGADVLIGGAGNDTLEVADASFKRVRGGRGTDTLRLLSGDLDLGARRGAIADIEAIDLGQGGAHLLTLAPVDLLRLSTSSNSLVVLGGSGATVATPTGDWLALGPSVWNGHTVKGYTSGRARLYVEQGVVTRIPPTFTASAFTLTENPGDGASVGKVQAVDADGQVLSLTFTGGDGDVFGFEPATGSLTVKDGSRIDHEKQSLWTLAVTALDSSGLSREGEIKITVTNAAEPPVVTASAQMTTIPENPDDGTVLLALAAVDEDLGDKLTWSLTTGNTDQAFAIDPSTGVLTVANGGKLDHEVAATRTLTARVTDQAGLYDEATITVHISDVTTVTKQATYTFSSAPASVVGTKLAPSTYGLALGNFSQPTTKSYAIGGGPAFSVGLDVTTAGTFDWSLDVLPKSGSFSASLPMQIALDFPDAIKPGVPFTLTSSWSLQTGASMAGTTSGLSFGAKVDLEKWSMSVKGTASSQIYAAASQTKEGKLGPVSTGPQKYTKEFGGDGWSARRFQADYPAGTPATTSEDVAYLATALGLGSSFVNKPNLLWTTVLETELYDSYYDWNSYLEATLPTWLGAQSGHFEMTLGQLEADVKYRLMPAAYQYVWAGVRQAYFLDTTGVNVTVTFENGQKVTFSAGDSPEITLPASADVNKDGTISLTAVFTPRATFTSYLNPYFRMDQYWKWFLLETTVSKPNEINQFSGKPYDLVLAHQKAGPVLTFGLSTEYNFSGHVAAQAEKPEAYSAWLATVAVTQQTFQPQSFDVAGWTVGQMKGSLQLTP